MHLEHTISFTPKVLKFWYDQATSNTVFAKNKTMKNQSSNYIPLCKYNRQLYENQKWSWFLEVRLLMMLNCVSFFK